MNETIQKHGTNNAQNTVNTSAHTTKSPHTLQNTHTPTHYKTSSNNHSTRYTPNKIVTIQSSTLSIRSP